ncbi:PPC domain-containing DNA-binding protein [Cryobacterium sp. MLB-32]|uniref:PCC domain-containing protein n=1 Tax=Cryobacterium sp. MLB-32 TaxID=1529318 RepID=UPI00068E4F02|nr:PPC domain-containing DNA-binding protein [Cryobacterium sp. MLB-32]
MLTLDHPGPLTQPRILSVVTTPVAAMQLLTPNTVLAAELFRILADLNLTSGMAELIGGTLAPISYCVPARGDDGREVSYSEKRTETHGQLIFGAATLGLRDGEPWMHSHCVWLTPEGRLQAGHLWPETGVGSPPPLAVVQGLPGVDLESTDDPETRLPVFTPHAATETVLPAEDAGLNRTVVARVCPNEDISLAVEKICTENGFENAVVRGGIGSLIGATFAPHNGITRARVDGPCTEVVTLVGHVTRTAEGIRSQLTCTLVDTQGVVHAGALVRGENPVSVTYELFVQEITLTTSPLPATHLGEPS